MKNIFRIGLFVLLAACAVGNASAQEKRSAFQLTFFPPLGTNGREAAQYTNTVSLNLLVGISKNEEAVAFGGLANLINHNSNGVQFAGLLNAVGNRGEGLLFSGLLNGVGRQYDGAQFAGLANSTREAMDGVQFAGLLNRAKEIDGAQFSALANVAAEVEGAQFAGLLNIARKVDGVQVATLINIAEESSTPIGLLNLIKNGKKSVGVTYNEIGSTIAAFRSGGSSSEKVRYRDRNGEIVRTTHSRLLTYGILGAGYNHRAKDDVYVILAGLGATIRCTPWLSIDNELTFESLHDFKRGTETFRTGYTLLPAFSFGRLDRPYFEVFAGPGVYYQYSENMGNIDLFPKHSLWKKHGASKLQQVHIGYLLGARYVF